MQMITQICRYNLEIVRRSCGPV